MSTWVFDVDGVIVDTKELVFEAYKRAGCSMPPELFGVHWTKWMPDAVDKNEIMTPMAVAEQVHDLKTEIYLEMLASGEKLVTLPGYSMAEALPKMQHAVYFITSMDERAAETIFTRLQLDKTKLLGVGLKHEERSIVLKTIKRMQRYETSFVYVDDRTDGKAIANEAGYKFTHADWN